VNAGIFKKMIEIWFVKEMNTLRETNGAYNEPVLLPNNSHFSRCGIEVKMLRWQHPSHSTAAMPPLDLSVYKDLVKAF
jgi:hypothetical protein